MSFLLFAALLLQEPVPSDPPLEPSFQEVPDWQEEAEKFSKKLSNICVQRQLK